MSYNCRLFDYPDGQHVTFYKYSIGTDTKKEENTNFRKSYKKEDRTEKEELHCKEVSYNKTKNRIYQIARSNTWEWFITLTFDRTRTDSGEYDLVTERLQNFLENIKKRKCPNLIYLIVPELHKDGKHYHFHGLLAGCGKMRFAYSGHDDKNGNMIFNMSDWTLGFSTATRVQDCERVSRYITKYITKESMDFLKNKKRFYCPQNINIVESEKLSFNEDDFLNTYKENIVYAKSVNIQEAGQHINYYEVKY